jgi:hypothetical protein
MKNTITQHLFFSKKTFKKLKTQSLLHKIIGVIRELEHWIGMIIIKRELNNLNEYSTNLIQRLGKNYQSQQKKSNFVCVYSSANAYNLTHNEVAENIEKCQKLSEARWNDELIEYICNH